MFKILLIALSFVILSYQVNMKIWDQAGEYTLTPEYYGYSDNIIIQLWGAGSGSFQQWIQQGGTSQAGGNSGAYISMNINTIKQETFYFTIGRGGNCSIVYNPSAYQTWYGLPGNYSTFYNEDKSLLLNVSGGYGSSNYGGSGVNATVTVLKYRADDIVMHNINGTISPTIITSSNNYCVCNCGGRGASSPYGPYGGSYQATPQCDGYMGSGAGYGCNQCVYDRIIGCIRPYKGGDGALVVYY